MEREEKYTDTDIVSIIILTDKNTDAYKLYKAKNFESDDSFVGLYKNIKYKIVIFIEKGR